MISRVAESCFWLHRYMERVESTARALNVNVMLLLDLDVSNGRQWRGHLVAAGEEERFLERFGEALSEEGEAVQAYLTWDEENPVSILSSLRLARDNARTIRETISLEMWQSLNEFWHWMRGGAGRRLYNRERLTFYETLRDRCFGFHGATQSTVLHEEPFDFMRLGMHLERAGQTARIMDMKHQALGPTTTQQESAAETVEWLAILRSCSAYEPFFKRSKAGLSGRTVAEFLLLEESFPRSVLHALTRSRNFLSRIRQRGNGVGEASAERLERLLAWLEASSVDTLLEEGIEEALTRVIDETSEVAAQVSGDFFHHAGPAVPAGT